MLFLAVMLVSCTKKDDSPPVDVVVVEQYVKTHVENGTTVKKHYVDVTLVNGDPEVIYTVFIDYKGLPGTFEMSYKKGTLLVVKGNELIPNASK